MHPKVWLEKWLKYLFHIRFKPEVGNINCTETKKLLLIIDKIQLFQKYKFHKNKFAKTCMS